MGRHDEHTAGDVLLLHSEVDGMIPGWYTILVIHDAKVHLSRTNSLPRPGEILPGALCSTNIYNLCAFSRAGLRIPMESQHEGVER